MRVSFQGIIVKQRGRIVTHGISAMTLLDLARRGHLRLSCRPSARLQAYPDHPHPHALGR